MNWHLGAALKHIKAFVRFTPWPMCFQLATLGDQVLLIFADCDWPRRPSMSCGFGSLTLRCWAHNVMSPLISSNDYCIYFAPLLQQLLPVSLQIQTTLQLVVCRLLSNAEETCVLIRLTHTFVTTNHDQAESAVRRNSAISAFPCCSDRSQRWRHW